VFLFEEEAPEDTICSLILGLLQDMSKRVGQTEDRAKPWEAEKQCCGG